MTALLCRLKTTIKETGDWSSMSLRGRRLPLPVEQRRTFQQRMLPADLGRSNDGGLHRLDVIGLKGRKPNHVQAEAIYDSTGHCR
jgi:hypothetical protein